MTIVRRPLAPITAALLAALALTGCGPAAFGWNLWPHHEKVPARYTLPAGKTVLIFVDDPAQRMPVWAEEEFAHMLAEQLPQTGGCSVVDPTRLAELRRRQARPDAILPGQAARELGAEVVVYVRVVSFALRDDQWGGAWRGAMRTAVRVIQPPTPTEASQVVWPKTYATGYPVTCRQRKIPQRLDAAGARQLAHKVSQTMARAVADLFRDHTKRVGPYEEQEFDVRKGS